MKNVQKQLARAAQFWSRGQIENAAQAYGALYKYAAGNDVVVSAYIQFLNGVEDWQRLVSVLEAHVAQ